MDETFKMMEVKLLRIIINPAMILVFDPRRNPGLG